MSVDDNGPSPQELASLRAIARDGTIHAAVAALTVSPHTVDSQLDKLRRKTGLRHLRQLVAWAAENHGLVSR